MDDVWSLWEEQFPRRGTQKSPTTRRRAPKKRGQVGGEGWELCEDMGKTKDTSDVFQMLCFALASTISSLVSVASCKTHFVPSRLFILRGGKRDVGQRLDPRFSQNVNSSLSLFEDPRCSQNVKSSLSLFEDTEDEDVADVACTVQDSLSRSASSAVLPLLSLESEAGTCGESGNDISTSCLLPYACSQP